MINLAPNLNNQLFFERDECGLTLLQLSMFYK